MVQQKKWQKRLKAKHDKHLQVYTGPFSLKNGWPIFSVARGVCVLLDAGLYPFLTPNGQGIPVLVIAQNKNVGSAYVCNKVMYIQHNTHKKKTGRNKRRPSPTCRRSEGNPTTAVYDGEYHTVRCIPHKVSALERITWWKRLQDLYKIISVSKRNWNPLDSIHVLALTTTCGSSLRSDRETKHCSSI